MRRVQVIRTRPFLGQYRIYNKNQIRDKLLLVLIFLEIDEVVEWQGYGIGYEKQYYMLRNVVNVALCANIMKCVKMMGH